MPIMTMLVRERSSFDASRAASITWLTISPVVRFRVRPIMPVAQKAQPTAQPT